MKDINKDILLGLMFASGIWSFVSGLFIFSTISFGSAAIYSNIVTRAKLNG